MTGGNYGIADVALALKFVHDNAALIGGNSNKIVINGESAGSFAVMALLLHDPSAELISGAIAQSGGTISNFMGTMEDASMNILISQVCAEIENCDQSENVENQINQLKNTADAKQLFNLATEKIPRFGPVPHDGVFYTANALDKYLNNNLNTNFKV